jgi:hypothetical protein
MLIELVKDCVEQNINATNLVFGNNLFINYYPDNPDTIVSVIDGGGYPPALYTPTREKIIEFKFRTDSIIDGDELGNELLNLFHDKENYYLNKKRILHSYARTDANYLYKDDDERLEYTLEVVFLIQK